MTDYTPIDCDLHSAYELAIMRRSRLRLYWYSHENRERTGILQPVDLVTRNHEEFLLAEDRRGKSFEIRLDRVISSQVVPGTAT